jgi:hypothetical protein
MRALTEEETRLVFEKLHKFIGKAIKNLVSDDAEYCLRLQKGRVYYVRDDIMRRATNVARDKLVGLGSCIGKFTHNGRFRLTVGSLDVLSKYAKYKVRACTEIIRIIEIDDGFDDLLSCPSLSNDAKNFFSLQTEHHVCGFKNLLSNTWTDEWLLCGIACP